MEGPEDAQEIYDQTFIEAPAILDKHKAAAQIADGKSPFSLPALAPGSALARPEFSWLARWGTIIFDTPN